MPNIFSFLPVLVTALIAFFVYQYRNRIGFRTVAIPCHVPKDHPDITISGMFQRLYAERLTVRNNGLRSLENVELHFTVGDAPISMSVGEPSTLSKTTIQTIHEGEVIKIVIPALPRSEEFTLDILRLGHHVPARDRLRGTGGKYKIIRTEQYELNKQIINLVWLGVVLLTMFVMAFSLDARIQADIDAKAAANPKTTLPGS